MERDLKTDEGKSQERSRGASGTGSHFQAVFNSAYLYVWLLTPDGTLAEANDAALHVGDLRRNDVVWRPFWETPWWRQPDARESIGQAVGLAASGETVRLETSLATPEMSTPVDLTLRPYHDAFGHLTLLIAEARDMTDTHLAERYMAASARRFDTLLASLQEGVAVLTPELDTIALNDGARNLLKMPSDATSLMAHWTPLQEDLSPLPDAQHPATVALQRNAPHRALYGHRAATGDAAWHDVTACPLRDEKGSTEGVLLVLRDVTQLRQQQQQLRHHAEHDALTNLPNRQAFFAGLQQAAHHGEAYAVLQIDLDSLKQVNDLFGHGIGDELLARFGERLARCLRPQDFVSHLGGGEYGVLLLELGDDANVLRVAHRMLEQIRQPFALGQDLVNVTASIGIALGRPGRDTEAVLKNVELALRDAKLSGRDRLIIHDEDLSREHEERIRFGDDLRSAVGNNQLEVFYQPLVDPRTREVVGAEALMRWRHPVRGLVSPAEFIPLAERTGLIVAMEGWLFEEALHQLHEWRQVKPDFHMSMNLSGRQLEQPDFVETLASRIAAAGVPAEAIQLEVTETYAMERSEDKSELLHRIAELGVTLAVDDFGTGYSNLGHLQHLPFGVVKIDRSFMRDVPDDPRNFALVRTIIAMAQSLELEIIAEGVETNTQADFLYWEGATLLQGFHFDAPLPAELFTSRHVKASEPAS